MIKEMTLLGYKGQSSRVDYTLDKYTFVMGANAAGKSTFIDGLRTAMLGIVPENAVHAGSKDAVSLVKMDDGTEIKTVASDDAATVHYLNGKKFTKKDVAAKRSGYLNLPPEIAEIFYREGQYCLDLKPEEFSKLIGSILPAMTTADLTQALNLTPEEEALFKSIYSGTNVDFEDIAKIYKDLSEKLRVLNRDIASAEQTATILCKGNTGRPLDLLKKKREGLLTQLKTFRDAEELQREYEAKNAAYVKHMTEIKELQAKLANKPESVAPGEIENAIATLNRVNQKLKEEAELFAVLKTNIETSRKILDELASSVCPISQKLVCTTDKSSVRADLEKTIADNQRMIDIHKGRVLSAESVRKATEEQITSLREKERRQQEYLRLEETLAVLKANMPPVPCMPTAAATDSSAISKELDQLNEEIANAGNAEQSRRLMDSIKVKKTEQAVVEKLRKMLAPKGEAYNIILDRVCGSLNQEMNATAMDLGSQREYEFRVEDGMTLYGKKAGAQNMIPVRNMSTGERFLAHMTLTALINKIVGLNFVILDNLDCLDQENLQHVLDFVTSPAYEKRFENVVLAGVNHIDTLNAVNKIKAARNDVQVINLVA